LHNDLGFKGHRFVVTGFSQAADENSGSLLLLPAKEAAKWSQQLCNYFS
jgi:hypothetical protein